MLNFFNTKAQWFYNSGIKMVVIVVAKWWPSFLFDRLIRSKSGLNGVVVCCLTTCF